MKAMRRKIKLVWWREFKIFMLNKKTVGQQERDDFSATCASIISGTISVFLTILVTVFPLIYRRAYFDILEVKYQCYYLTVIGMLAVSLLLGIVMLLIDAKEFQGSHGKAFFAKLAPKNWKTTFRATDVAVIVFWLASLISTLQSKYLFESFWGNEGRYTGLFLTTLYVAAYFLISKCWKFKGWILELFLVSGMVMCVIGITDYFQMDILDFRGAIKPEQSTIFTSTVGNINTYTAYVALVMGFAAAMFAVEKNTVRMIWYYVCMVISFFAIIMGCSDNAYLALGALFICLPFVLFRSWTGLRRYLVIVASFFTVIQCIDVINQKYAEIVIGLDSLFGVIVEFGGLHYVVAVLWGMTAGVYFYCRRKYQKYVSMKNQENSDSIGKMPVRVWGIVVSAAVLIVCFMLFDANAAGNGARYGALRNYLEFSDSWGTNRGYIWRKSLEMYREFPLKYKLFGYGPDTFGILTTNKIKFDMINATTQIFDTAHNEYIQFLLTIGPIGMAAYVTALLSAARRFMKRYPMNPAMLGCGAAVVCYAAQALVNLNLPIATPMMWLMMSAGMAASREAFSR